MKEQTTNLTHKAEPKFAAIRDYVLSGKRLTRDEAKELYYHASLEELGELAHEVRKGKSDPTTVTYIVDRNLNYTNVCITYCKFCAFYRRPGHKESYVLSKEVLRQKVQETIDLGGTGLLLQGGHHPDLKLGYYVDLLQFIHSIGKIWIHGFSSSELQHIAQLENKPVKEIIATLKEAGLNSVPGGGAEILDDEVRQKIAPLKTKTADWLEVHKAAHELGLRSTATMMFGHVETLDQRFNHFDHIRNLQDQTGGFTAFISWTYQNENTHLKADKVSTDEYLRMQALSRIYLDNIQNIQSSWVTQGLDIGKKALYYGANDMGSIMIEENVVRLAGAHYQTSEQQMRNIIEEAGFKPLKRNSIYSKFYG